MHVANYVHLKSLYLDLIFVVTLSIYWGAPLFFIVASIRRDALAGNPTKERGTWKGKCEVMEQSLSSFQKELVELREKVKLVEALQEEAKIHDSPSTLVRWIA